MRSSPVIDWGFCLWARISSGLNGTIDTMMKHLLKTLDVSGQTVTLKAWGATNSTSYARALFDFVLAFGKAAEQGETDGEFEEAFGRMERLIDLSIVDDKITDYGSLTFDDKVLLAEALWELNGLSGDGVKKLLSLYLRLTTETTTKYLSERSAEMSK